MATVLTVLAGDLDIVICLQNRIDKVPVMFLDSSDVDVLDRFASSRIDTDFEPDKPALLETAFGGMSGAPVHSLHRGGVAPLQLIGIIRTYGAGLDVLYCTRADIISADGTITIGPEAHSARPA
jgi:hypothetical protein